jgi:acetolactate synthase-1/2/3 large subunit
VVCFCGDGGFYYHLSELETARRWNLPVTVIVNNNASLGQDIPGVREVYGAETGRAEDLTHFEPVDFAEVAKAFGCQGIRVENRALWPMRSQTASPATSPRSSMSSPILSPVLRMPGFHRHLNEHPTPGIGIRLAMNEDFSSCR